MTEHVERLRILVGEDRDSGAVGKRPLQIAHVAVDADRESRFCEPRAHGPGEVRARRARRQGLLAPIRQDDLNLGRSHV